MKNLDEKYCSDCGNLIKIRAEICPHCGIRQSRPYVRQNDLTISLNGRDKTVAALLAFFLGWMGAHKFYLGEITMGVIYLLFCWTFIPALISFIEFFILLSMTDSKFQNRYSE